MLTKNILSYLALILTLLTLSLIFLNLSIYRIPIAILIGISYFVWGMFTHWQDKTLHLPVVLEYLGLSLLAIILLIFISLRA